MRIGIIGGLGFIGSHLAKRIISPTLFQDDMRVLYEVKAFIDSLDRVYHVAGLNRDREGRILANNIVSTGNLVLASKINRQDTEIVFISSKQVEWNPDSEYGLAKRIEEETIKMAKKWCIFRVPNVYGERCKPFYNSVVATFAYQIAHGQKVTIAKPEATREFIYIGDLVDKLIEPHFSGYINIQGEIMSIGQVHEYLTSRLGEHKKLQKCLDFYKGGNYELSRSRR